MRYSKFLLPILLILAIILRFFQLQENMIFHGELGSNYLFMKNMVIGKSIPLNGPPTSHPWLSFGPYFYWLFTPILVMFNYDPLSGAVFFGAVGVLIVYVNYKFVEMIFSRSIAFFSSLFIVFSPLYLHQAREARFFSIVLIIIYPLFYFLTVQKLFWAGFFFSLLLQFHLSPIIFVPSFIVLAWVHKNRISISSYRNALIGFLIPWIPLVIYDSTHKFTMLLQFTAWVPYRVLGFVGIIPKNNVSASVITSNFNSFFRFLQDLFLLGDFSSIITLTIFIIICTMVWKKTKVKYVLLFLIVGVIGIFIHGDPPSHYYIPLYPLPILIVSIWFDSILGNRYAKPVILFMFVTYLLTANRALFSPKWFFKSQDFVELGKPVPYILQKSISKYIIEDAGGRHFQLMRSGEFDHFELQYAQNYHYLLWLYGNEPVSSSQLIYTIYEISGSKPFIIKKEI